MTQWFLAAHLRQHCTCEPAWSQAVPLARMIEANGIGTEDGSIMDSLSNATVIHAQSMVIVRVASARSDGDGNLSTSDTSKDLSSHESDREQADQQLFWRARTPHRELWLAYLRPYVSGVGGRS